MIEVVQEGIVERCQAKHPERAMQCDHFADHFGSHQHAISPTECARWPSEDDVEDAHAVAEIEAMTDEECEAYLVDEEQGITREVVRDWGRGAAVFAKAMVAAKQKCEALALENSRLVDVDIRLGSAEQTLAQVSEERDSLRRAVEEYLPQPNGDAQRRGDPDAWNAAMFNLGNLKKEADTARAEAEQLRAERDALAVLVETSAELLDGAEEGEAVSDDIPCTHWAARIREELNRQRQAWRTTKGDAGK